ncbi:MAG: hypothetical protein COU11_03355 [Candidatus Harrisonbacteria bacterium CG10_big_fil_rev_8_21_14_0_10_49_15]|uniref:TraC-like domain-containing protein n=1 Tax=Candidatus Harrisonbacteria bacterium CG10_big_fil_rev_8_21_14_0_10_49_15 TaxID=1974587 RepID=A0A2H0UKD2_9BACT|nr:MAG: hypothetical protein COU11_03355 [Candidatus Harrisonbacteria bacterium CG10_big_fil_rev_8_21_14_0_10_49_15]
MSPAQSSKSKEALPTQKFVEVKGTKDGVLILKNGSLRQILAVSGINFDLKSEDEQQAIVASYQSFLNSLNFSLQIFVHSRKINTESYVEHLQELEAREVNPLLKTQLGEYREFIKSFTIENAIMSKNFFVVVPYDPIQIPGKGSGGVLGFFGKKKKGAEAQKKQADAEDATITKQLSQLAQRTDQITTGLNQLGLRSVALNDDEVVELFYNLYNPDAVEKKGLDLSDDNEKKAA